jgi:hypothetical protein
MLDLVAAGLAEVSWRKAIWPLSVPFIFAAIWHGTYALSQEPVPSGAIRVTVVWLAATLLVVPVVLGLTFMLGMVAHGGVGFLLLWFAAAVVIWVSIIPILIAKTIRASLASRDDT